MSYASPGQKYRSYAWLCYQCANRADSDTGEARSTPSLSQGYTSEGTYYGVYAPIGEIEYAGALFMTYPNTFPTYYAFIGIVGEQSVA